MILALSGGVGGAKLAQGLAFECAVGDLLIVVNTGDDFNYLGFHVSPDLDTVMYCLAGINDATRGWGIKDETWNFMAAAERLGTPTWFKIGDHDLATHVERTRRLAAGETLSEVTRFLCGRLGVRHRVAPMSDGQVGTIVHTSSGALDFQDYFVRLRCEPPVTGIEYRGVPAAAPAPEFATALWRDDLAAIVMTPSNPLLSIGPIIGLPNVSERIKEHSAPVIAVSPLVGGQAIKGPAAKIFRELGLDPTALGIARHYHGLIDGMVIDEIDSGLVDAIERLGIPTHVANTVMRNREDQQLLARHVLKFAMSLRKPRNA
jgi:LPPG:FO 2-phospho-L-lactate transferase